MYLQADLSIIDKSIYIASGILALLVMLLLFFVVLYRKSHNIFLKEKELMNAQFAQALLQSQIEVQEETFSALGKELHDNIGQLLSTTKMLLGITQRNMPSVPDTLLTAENTLGQAIGELRSLSKSMSREWLEQFNLLQNLQAEVTRVNAGHEVMTYLTGSDRLSLSSDKQIILFRIIQEALQNAIKHAQASHIWLSITEDPSGIITIIKDDGIGIAAIDVVKGLGMINMQHRTQLLDGTIEWKPADVSGTCVQITIPK